MKVCIWKNNGSTSKDGKNEAPDFCKKEKCPGCFKNEAMKMTGMGLLPLHEGKLMVCYCDIESE